ncbi:hypothetical protein [Halopseudomonas salina]|nr:hypothetical protein [Halopseudomonas salina]
MEYQEIIELDGGNRMALIYVAGDKTIPIKEANSNIVCFDNNMNIIWRVSAPATGFERDSFVELNKESNGIITGRRFFGNTYTINPSTGEATQSGWQK